MASNGPMRSSSSATRRQSLSMSAACLTRQDQGPVLAILLDEFLAVVLFFSNPSAMYGDKCKSMRMGPGIIPLRASRCMRCHTGGISQARGITTRQGWAGLTVPSKGRRPGLYKPGSQELRKTRARRRAENGHPTLPTKARASWTFSAGAIIFDREESDPVISA
jgi:hypothetical protein